MLGNRRQRYASLLIICPGEFRVGSLRRPLAWFFVSAPILSVLNIASGIGGLAVGPALSTPSAWDVSRKIYQVRWKPRSMKGEIKLPAYFCISSHTLGDSAPHITIIALYVAK
ncbi:hypothetical protein [Candidatus Methanocrinis natronophilus]|uniref:Uncharacterized protein n=1 Tax=Candidatus Methanocrinis natronophilus TaxID=3033396 RepID=A0ABT5X6K2_9EURY|nr:hypothetical protein [Candidatus Methanocrinis natronophilus]MDF0590278.1 hypothetical protein [Candidatus Methanocrinis natronophilus]